MNKACNQRLREILSKREAVLLPGASNALTARIIEDLGFKAIYVTGAGVTNTFLGVPDIGLISMTELANHVSAVRDVVALPLIVDADTGFGNPINVTRTIRVLERSGANAIQLEDQEFPKLRTFLRKEYHRLYRHGSENSCRRRCSDRPESRHCSAH